jgi:hypothetical protein
LKGRLGAIFGNASFFGNFGFGEFVLFFSTDFGIESIVYRYHSAKTRHLWICLSKAEHQPDRARSAETVRGTIHFPPHMTSVTTKGNSNPQHQLDPCNRGNNRPTYWQVDPQHCPWLAYHADPHCRDSPSRPLFEFPHLEPAASAPRTGLPLGLYKLSRPHRHG